MTHAPVSWKKVRLLSLRGRDTCPRDDHVDVEVNSCNNNKHNNNNLSKERLDIKYDNELNDTSVQIKDK